jgi:hypothetical protein
MKRILIGLAAATATLFVGSWIVVATIGNHDNGWRGVIGGIFWFGFLLAAALFVAAALFAAVRSRIGRTAATLVVIALAAVGASQAATPAKVQFTLYSANVQNRDIPLLVQAKGAFSGVGTAIAKDDAPGASVPLLLRFRNGTLSLKVIDPFRWQANVETCTATERSTGTWSITGGTGAYLRMTGHGTFDEHGAGVGSRNASGACQQKFALNYVVAAAVGTAVRRS